MKDILTESWRWISARMFLLSVPEHMELRLLEQEVKQSEISLKQNTLDFFPKLSLGYNFSRSVSGADFEFDKYNTSHGLNLNASYSLLIFFTNGDTKTRVKINQLMLNLSYLDAVDNSRRAENMTKELEYTCAGEHKRRLNLANRSALLKNVIMGMINCWIWIERITSLLISVSHNRYQIIQSKKQ